MDVCIVCSRGPARVLHLRRNVGMVLAWRWHRLDAPLCREHGWEAGWDWMLRTFLLGWWGITSLVVNVWAILRNAVALVRAYLLEPPAHPMLTPTAPLAGSEWSWQTTRSPSAPVQPPSSGRLSARPALKFFGIAMVFAVLVGAWLSSVSLEETSGIEVVTELRGGRGRYTARVINRGAWTARLRCRIEAMDLSHSQALATDSFEVGPLATDALVEVHRRLRLLTSEREVEVSTDLAATCEHV